MKKTIACVLMVFLLAGCGSASAAETEKKEKPSQTRDTVVETTPEATATPEATVTPAPKVMATPSPADATEDTGLDPAFKKAVDDYVAFFDSYAETMKSAGNGNSVESLTNYADMISKEAEMNKSWAAMGDDDMTTAEYNYYIDANAHIQKKLIEAAQ